MTTATVVVSTRTTTTRWPHTSRSGRRRPRQVQRAIFTHQVVLEELLRERRDLNELWQKADALHRGREQTDDGRVSGVRTQRGLCQMTRRGLDLYTVRNDGGTTVNSQTHTSTGTQAQHDTTFTTCGIQANAHAARWGWAYEWRSAVSIRTLHYTTLHYSVGCTPNNASVITHVFLVQGRRGSIEDELVHG